MGRDPIATGPLHRDCTAVRMVLSQLALPVRSPRMRAIAASMSAHTMYTLANHSEAVLLIVSRWVTTTTTNNQ